MEDRRVVLVTGFGPFRDHKINASWEAVKELQKYDLCGYNLICEEIAVNYCTVDSCIPELWQKHNPKLVLHVGVSHLTDTIKIEQIAFRTGYNQNDCLNNQHPSGCVTEDGPDALETSLDVNYICDKVQNETGLKCEPSKNAGRYLCEYTYYTSLKLDSSKSLFVHVPMLDQPYSASQLGAALFQIVSSALDLLYKDKL